MISRLESFDILPSWEGCLARFSKKLTIAMRSQHFSSLKRGSFQLRCLPSTLYRSQECTRLPLFLHSQSRLRFEFLERLCLQLGIRYEWSPQVVVEHGQRCQFWLFFARSWIQSTSGFWCISWLSIVSVTGEKSAKGDQRPHFLYQYKLVDGDY